MLRRFVMNIKYRYLLGGFMGDYIGSIYEFNNFHDINFPIFTLDSHFTDDSFMTCAVMDSLTYIFNLYGTLELDEVNVNEATLKEVYQKALIENFRKWYRNHPNGDYGLLFEYWLEEGNIEDTTGDSYGNGALMRVSPCAYISSRLSTCLQYARWTTEVSHDNPISYTAVDCYISMLHYAHTEYSWDTEKTLNQLLTIFNQFYPNCKFQSIEQLRQTTEHEPTCQATMPLIIPCLFSCKKVPRKEFKKTYMYGLRTAISIGGDSDTIGTIIGCLLAHIYPMPIRLSSRLEAEMDFDMMRTIDAFSDVLNKKTK